MEETVEGMAEFFDARAAGYDEHYHIDIPCALDTQRALLLEAGFKDFELVWEKDSADVWNAAVYAVTK